MPKGGIRPAATCHPDRPHYAKGSCYQCWRSQNGKTYRKTKRGKESTRRWKRSSKYGLSDFEFKALWELQAGRCGICGQPMLVGPKAHIDHDHLKGTVRGLLCYSCNMGIGRLEDNPHQLLSAVSYLISPPFSRLSAPSDKIKTPHIANAGAKNSQN